VPHIHQLWDTPDVFDGHWACGPTSSTMVLAYYKLLKPKPIRVASPTAHESLYGWYLSNPFSQGSYGFEATAASPHGLVPGIYGTALDNHGSPSNAFWVTGPFKTSNSFAPRGRGIQAIMEIFGLKLSVKTPKQGRYFKPTEFADLAIANLKRGHPLIMGGDVNGYGHVIVVRGFYLEGGQAKWIVNDPYGFRTSGKVGGGNVVYGFDEIRPRWMCLMGGLATSAAPSKAASRGLVENILDAALDLAFNFLLQKFGSVIPATALSVVRPILAEFMQSLDSGQVRIPARVRLELQARLDDALRQAGVVGK
jgi:hypothetical protein